MNQITEQAVLEQLGKIKDPDLRKDIVTLGFVKDLKIDGGNVSLVVERFHDLFLQVKFSLFKLFKKSSPFFVFTITSDNPLSSKISGECLLYPQKSANVISAKC